MPTKQTVLEEFTSEDGTHYQLLYAPANAAPWTLVINGVMEESFDEYSVARQAWRETIRAVEE